MPNPVERLWQQVRALQQQEPSLQGDELVLKEQQVHDLTEVLQQVRELEYLKTSILGDRLLTSGPEPILAYIAMLGRQIRITGPDLSQAGTFARTGMLTRVSLAVSPSPGGPAPVILELDHAEGYVGVVLEQTIVEVLS